VEHDVEDDDEDDEEFYLRLLPSPRFKARRASIRPLVIAAKSTAGSPVPLVEIEQGQEGKEQQEPEQEKEADEADEESDYEELNDWYTQQLSDILTLYSSPRLHSLLSLLSLRFHPPIFTPKVKATPPQPVQILYFRCTPHFLPSPHLHPHPLLYTQK
jgi:hypothetical protein